MKVIDLLNKIANGEEVPKKIKPSWYAVEEYLYYDEETKDYYNKEDTYELIGTICLFLNDEVEIIEDEKINKLIDELVDKVNEIIDHVNKENDK